jgi:hypothetical protein
MNEKDPHAHEAVVADDGVVIVSEVDPVEVETSLAGPLGASLPEMVRRSLASWAEDTRGSTRRPRSIFERDKFVTPSKIFEQMGMAYDAAEDDVVGNVLDTSESIAFQKVHFESDDKDQQDVWNQIGADLDLDTYVRIANRELMLASQFYGVRWWGRKTYRVRGKGEQRARRKEYDLVVPTFLGLLDPTRVVPVGVNLFGGANLAWVGSMDQLALYGDKEEGVQSDELVSNLFVGKYQPSKQEEQALSKEDIPTDNLLLLNPEFVFRHTLTKSPFERWARIRMKSIFPLLDLKHQLREMDRAWLLGGINFIVLVTRGSDTMPTTQSEVNETANMVRAQSKSPIIVSDHRIEITIITPNVEHVLDDKKWGVLDERIMMRLWGTFSLSSDSGNSETSLTLGRVIARGLQSRRHMLKRALERELIRPVGEINEDFDASTKLNFAPRRIELDFDAGLLNSIQELRDRGDLSRETTLNELGFDQSLEAQRRKREDEEFEGIFDPVNVPFDSPNRTTPGGSGRQGGRPVEGEE